MNEVADGIKYWDSHVGRIVFKGIEGKRATVEIKGMERELWVVSGEDAAEFIEYDWNRYYLKSLITDEEPSAMNDEKIRLLNILAAKKVKHNQNGIEVDSVPITKLSSVFDFDTVECMKVVAELVAAGFAEIVKQSKNMPPRISITEKGRKEVSK